VILYASYKNTFLSQLTSASSQIDLSSNVTAAIPKPNGVFFSNDYARTITYERMSRVASTWTKMSFYDHEFPRVVKHVNTYSMNCVSTRPYIVIYFRIARTQNVLITPSLRRVAHVEKKNITAVVKYEWYLGVCGNCILYTLKQHPTHCIAVL